VYKAGSAGLKDAMDLGYMLGQRPVDVLALSEDNIIQGAVVLRQTKTQKSVRIEIRGQLKTLLARMQARREAAGSLSHKLLVDERGKPMTKAKLRIRFEAAREKVGALTFQFRDLRRKAAADLRDIAGIDKAQKLLAHSDSSQTEHYASGKPRVVTDLPKMTLKRPKKKGP
jgi:integrase